MHKLIVCCLLIAAVCAAPAPSATSERRKTGDDTTKNYPLTLLKSVWSQLLARLEKLGRDSLLDVVPALIQFVKDRNWENLISSILKGKEYIQMKNQSKTTLQFIKANGTDIALELFRIFGAEGEDLTSVLTAILQDPLAKLLRTLFKSLTDEVAKAIVGILTGIVKLAVKLVINPQEKWSALSKFMSDDIVAVVKVFLPSVFDNAIVKYWLGMLTNA